MSFINRSIILMVSLGLFVSAAEPLWAGYNNKTYSPLSVKIKLKKETYKLREPIKGEVIIENTYPYWIPAVFKVILFHDEILFTEKITSVPKVPFGRTPFSLQSFGIDSFNNLAGAEGKWRIKIVQQNMDDSYAAEGILIITAPTKSKKKL